MYIVTLNPDSNAKRVPSLILSIDGVEFLMLHAVWKKTNHNPPYIVSLSYPPIQEGWWIYEREDLDVSPSTPTPTCLNVCQPTPPTPDSPLESPSLQHPPHPPQFSSGSIIRSKPTCNPILICQIPSSRRPFSCTLSPSSQCWDWRHNRCQSQWWPVWITPSSFFSDPVQKDWKIWTSDTAGCTFAKTQENFHDSIIQVPGTRYYSGSPTS